MVAIYGNNDGERHGIYLKFQEVGEIHQLRPHKLELAGKKILMMHEPNLLDDFIQGDQFDLILYGHNHQKKIRRDGDCLIVNPGETCGYLTGTASIAVVDLTEMTAEFRIIE